MRISKCCSTYVIPVPKGNGEFKYTCSKCYLPCEPLDVDDGTKNLLRKQQELIEKYWPDMLNKENRQNATNIVVLAMVGELAELMEGYKALPWKPERENREYILEELTDLMHFLLELYLIWGVDNWDTLVWLYDKKRKKNVDRGQIHQSNSNDIKEG